MSKTQSFNNNSKNEDIFIDPDQIVNKDLYCNISEAVTCIICSCMILDPVKCKSCENHFCKACVLTWTKKNNSCPYRCQNPTFEEGSRLLKNMLNKFEIRCPENCGSILLYEIYYKHVSDCKIKAINCPCCGSSVKKDNKGVKSFENMKNELDKLKQQLIEKNNKINELTLKINSSIFNKAEPNPKQLTQSIAYVPIQKPNENNLMYSNNFENNNKQFFPYQMPIENDIKNTNSNFYNRFNVNSAFQNLNVNSQINQNQNEFQFNDSNSKNSQFISNVSTKPVKVDKKKQQKPEKYDKDEDIMSKLLAPTKSKNKHEFIPFGCSYMNDQYKDSCSHYERNFSERLTCCDKVFKCNFDHNDKVAKHKKGRIRNWICNKCKYDQNKPFTDSCASCLAIFYSAKPQESQIMSRPIRGGY